VCAHQPITAPKQKARRSTSNCKSGRNFFIFALQLSNNSYLCSNSSADDGFKVALRLAPKRYKQAVENIHEKNSLLYTLDILYENGNKWTSCSD
jgi:hypothetical protein